MHFHRDLLAICDCFPRSVLRSQRGDTFIGTPPLAFTFGLGGLLLFPLRVGAAAVLLEKLTPDTLLQAVQDYRATVCFTAPTFYRQMAPLAAGYDISSLRKSVSAAEMKMCSISVAPMPSIIRSPVACCQASRVASGSASPADTDFLRLEMS